MYFGVAVDFAGGGVEDFGTGAFGESEHVDGSEYGTLHGLDGIPLVMDGACGAGHVVDFIDFEVDGLDDIVTDEFEVVVIEEVGDV